MDMSNVYQLAKFQTDKTFLNLNSHINFVFSMEKRLGDKNESLGDKNESLGDKNGNSHPLFYGSFMWE